ncbi:TPA: hypothetical protein NV728_002069 [Escherichia coli]|nr:hypothetical protein [Escherichia coli]
MAATNTSSTKDKKASTKKNDAPVIDQSLAQLEAELNGGETITTDATIPGALVADGGVEGGVDGADLLAELLGEAEIVDNANAVPAAPLPTNTGKVEAASVKPQPAPAKPNDAAGTVRPGVSAKTSEKIMFRLGSKAGDFLILETKDAELDEAALKARQEEMLKNFDGTSQIKVREKMVQLFGYLSDSNAKLNEVMRRAFTVLLKDGNLISGEKGNLHVDLLAKPYSVGTARAQSGQIFSLFPQLKIVNKTDRGVYVANPDSVILQMMKQRLGL